MDENEIKLWITRLETEESSWLNYERLAALYTIQNYHNQSKRKENASESSRPIMYSAAPSSLPAVVDNYGDSDFLQSVSGIDQSRAWAIMDEHMDNLKLINERLYNDVMRKIKRQ